MASRSWREGEKRFSSVQAGSNIRPIRSFFHVNWRHQIRLAATESDALDRTGLDSGRVPGILDRPVRSDIKNYELMLNRVHVVSGCVIDS